MLNIFNYLCIRLFLIRNRTPVYLSRKRQKPEKRIRLAKNYEEERTYNHYNGSYAQDVEGWSDQDIDIVFDGDPDAYWNID